MNHYSRSNPFDTLLGLLVIAGGVLTVLTTVAWGWETYQLFTSSQSARDVALYGRIASVVVVMFGLAAIRVRSAGYAAITAFAFSWTCAPIWRRPYQSSFGALRVFFLFLAFYPWLAIRFPEPSESRDRELASNPAQDQGASRLPQLPVTKPRKDLSSLVGMEELKGRLRHATEEILGARVEGSDPRNGILLIR